MFAVLSQLTRTAESDQRKTAKLTDFIFRLVSPTFNKHAHRHA